MSTPCRFETLRAQLQIPGIDSLSSHEIANKINVTFLEPMQTYQSIDPIHLLNQSQTCPRSRSKLFHLYCRNYLTKHLVLMASQTGFLKNILFVISSVAPLLINVFLPLGNWKLANIIPVPKQSPVQDVNNHLRPISLTSYF